MAQQGINVQVSIKEIYKKACPKCKKMIRTLIRERITDQMVTQVIGGE